MQHQAVVALLDRCLLTEQHQRREADHSDRRVEGRKCRGAAGVRSDKGKVIGCFCYTIKYGFSCERIVRAVQ